MSTCLRLLLLLKKYISVYHLSHSIFWKVLQQARKHGDHQQQKHCPSVISNQSNKIKNKNDYERHIKRAKIKLKQKTVLS